MITGRHGMSPRRPHLPDTTYDWTETVQTTGATSVFYFAMDTSIQMGAVCPKGVSKEIVGRRIARQTKALDRITCSGGRIKQIGVDSYV